MNFSLTKLSNPIKILLDTDMATDCDDAGAMAVLHTLASLGEAEILGIVTNNYDPASIGAVAAINAFYGKPEIPLGAYQGNEVGHPAADFVKELAGDTLSYGHTVTHRSQVTDAVETLRTVLAGSEDHSVVIVSIGHLNNLADLLTSSADSISPLKGVELIDKKVPHIVVMGGDYPSGKEHNFWARGSIPFTRKCLDLWPTPILFSGYSLGERIMTGPGLSNLPVHHPVRRAYAGYASRPLEKGRPSWDQTAVLAAVRGTEAYWQLSEPGRNFIHPDGRNSWENDPESPQVYLKEKASPKDLAAEITQLMTGAS